MALAVILFSALLFGNVFAFPEEGMNLITSDVFYFLTGIMNPGGGGGHLGKITAPKGVLRVWILALEFWAVLIVEHPPPPPDCEQVVKKFIT